MNKKAGKDKPNGGGTIALNKRARHEYHLEQTFEAGMALQGWELKALRAGRINFGDSYAVVLRNEVFLVGCSIPPLISASTHVIADDRRSRKLLLHRKEIDQLVGVIDEVVLDIGAGAAAEGMETEQICDIGAAAAARHAKNEDNARFLARHRRPCGLPGASMRRALRSLL